MIEGESDVGVETLAMSLANTSLETRLAAIEEVGNMYMSPGESDVASYKQAMKSLLVSYVDSFYNEKLWRSSVHTVVTEACALGSSCSSSSEGIGFNVIEFCMKILGDSKLASKGVQSKASIVELLVNIERVKVRVQKEIHLKEYEQEQEQDSVNTKPIKKWEYAASASGDKDLVHSIAIQCKLVEAIALDDKKDLGNSKALKRVRVGLLGLFIDAPSIIPLYFNTWIDSATASSAGTVSVGLLWGWIFSSHKVQAMACHTAALGYFSKAVMGQKVLPNERTLSAYHTLLGYISDADWDGVVAPVLVRTVKKSPESAASALASILSALPSAETSHDDSGSVTADALNPPNTGAFLTETGAAVLRMFKSTLNSARTAGVSIVGHAMRNCNDESSASSFLSSIADALAAKQPIGMLLPENRLDLALGAAAAANVIKSVSVSAESALAILAAAAAAATKEVNPAALQAQMTCIGAWLTTPALVGVVLPDVVVKIIVEGLKKTDRVVSGAYCASLVQALEASGESVLSLYIPFFDALTSIAADVFVLRPAAAGFPRPLLWAGTMSIRLLVEALSSTDAKVSAAAQKSLDSAKLDLSMLFSQDSSKSGIFTPDIGAHWLSASSQQNKDVIVHYALLSASALICLLSSGLGVSISDVPSILAGSAGAAVLSGGIYRDMNVRTASARRMDSLRTRLDKEESCHGNIQTIAFLANHLLNIATATSETAPTQATKMDDNAVQVKIKKTPSACMLRTAILSLVLGQKPLDNELKVGGVLLGQLMLLCGHPRVAEDSISLSERLWGAVNKYVSYEISDPDTFVSDLSTTILAAVYSENVVEKCAGCTAVRLFGMCGDQTHQVKSIIFRAQGSIFSSLLGALEAPGLVGVSRDDAEIWKNPRAALFPVKSLTVTEDDLKITNADRKKTAAQKKSSKPFGDDFIEDDEWTESKKQEKMEKLRETKLAAANAEFEIRLEQTKEMRSLINVHVGRARASLGVITLLAEELASVVARYLAQLVIALLPFLSSESCLIECEAMSCLQAISKFAVSSDNASASEAMEVAYALRAVGMTVYRPPLRGESISQQLEKAGELAAAIQRGLRRMQITVSRARSQVLGAPALILTLPMVHAVLAAATAILPVSGSSGVLSGCDGAFAVLDAVWSACGQLDASVLPIRPALIECCLRAMLLKTGSDSQGPELLLNRIASAEEMTHIDWSTLLGPLGMLSLTANVRRACFELSKRLGLGAHASGQSGVLDRIPQLLITRTWTARFDPVENVRAAGLAAWESWGMKPTNCQAPLLELIVPRLQAPRVHPEDWAASAAAGVLRVPHLTPKLSVAAPAKSVAVSLGGGWISGMAAKALACSILELSETGTYDPLAAIVEIEELFQSASPVAVKAKATATIAAMEVEQARGDSTLTKQDLIDQIGVINKLRSSDKDNFFAERAAIAVIFTALGELEAIRVKSATDQPAPIVEKASSGKNKGKGSKAVVSVPLSPIDASILPLLEFIVDEGATDADPTVRSTMVAAGSSLVLGFGAKQCRTMLALLQGVLARQPVASASDADLDKFDRSREAAVVLLGGVGRHLNEKDPEVLSITDAMVEALKTPSESVQLVVSDCLVALAAVLKTTQNDRMGKIVEDLLALAVGGGSYGDRRGAALGLAAMCKGLGLPSLKKHDVVVRLRDVSSSGGVNERQGALFIIDALSSRLGMLFEPYIITFMPILIKAFSHSSDHVRDAAKSAAKTIFSKISGHGIKQVLGPILLGLETEKQWKSRQESIYLLGTMAHCAPRQLASCLQQIVPKLVEAGADTHPKVKEAAKLAMSELASVIRSPEVSSMAPELLAALGDPAHKTKAALDALVSCEFMHTIDAPSLGLLMPILSRALKDRSGDLKRRSSFLTGNITQMVDDPKLLVPYLSQLLPSLKENVLDPIPDVRTTSARAMGQLVSGVGEREVGDLVPWLLEASTSESSPVERAGAAQGLAELCKSLGDARAKQIVQQSMTAATSTRMGAREGPLWLLTFLPLALGEGFSSFIGSSLPIVLQGLADDQDTVREVAMNAGKGIVNTMGIMHTQALLPSLSGGMYSPKWRIRQSSVILLGELLCLVSETKATTLTMSEEEEDTGESSNMGAAKVLNKLRTHIGADAADNAVAAIYIIRSDVALVVKQSASTVWKTLVSNTPRMISEIMPTLVKQLTQMLCSENPDLSAIAARSLGETVQKLGDRVLPVVVPHLQSGFKSDDMYVRRSVCVGLAEIMSNSTSKQIEVYASVLEPALRRAICDDDTDVRKQATAAFATMLKSVGPSAIDSVIPSLLAALKSAVDVLGVDRAFAVMVAGNATILSDEDTDMLMSDEVTDVRQALNGIRAAVQTRPRDMVMYLMPRFTGTKVLSYMDCITLGAMSSTGGQQLAFYLNTLVPLLVQSFTVSESAVQMEEDEGLLLRAVDMCASEVLCAIQTSGVSSLIDELGKLIEGTEPPLRRLGCRLLRLFVRGTAAEYSDYLPLLLRYLLSRSCDLEDCVLREVLAALVALGASRPHDDFINHMGFMQSCLMSTVSESKHSKTTLGKFRTDADGNMLTPLFCLPKSVDPLIPIFIHALLKGSPFQREVAANCIGEVVTMTDNVVLKPYLIKTVGPLIRVMGERFDSSVKNAILNTILLILKRGGIALKPFVPQLQTTFIKALSDPMKSVRVNAVSSLASLMVMAPKVDSVVSELCTACTAADSSAVKASVLAAVSSVIVSAGDKLTPETLSKVTLMVKEMIFSSDEGARSAAADTAKSLVARLESTDVVDLVLDICANTVDTVGDDGYHLTEGKLLAIGGIIGSAGSDKVGACSEEALSLIVKNLRNSHVSVVWAAVRAVGLAVSGEHGDNRSVQLTLLQSVATTVAKLASDHDSIDVREAAFFTMKQAGKHLLGHVAPFTAAFMKPIIKAVKGIDIRLKLCAERAMRYLLLDREGGDGPLIKYTTGSSVAGDEISFVRDYAKKHLIRQLAESDDDQ